MMLRVKPAQGTRRGVIAAIAAGVLLRAIFIHYHARFAGDTLTYGDLAHNLLNHHIFGFTEDRIRPTLIRLPGYPLFLAACFQLFGDANYVAVLWVQVLVDMATCILLGLLAARLMGRRAGLATLWLAALCPFTANYAAAALTETWSLFCVTLALFGLERWTAAWRAGQQGTRWLIAIGLALAYAVLLRPDQGLLAAAVIPAILWISLRSQQDSFPLHSEQREQPASPARSAAPTLPMPPWHHRLRPTLLTSLLVVLPLALWAARNERTFHVFQPLAPRYANDPGETVAFGFQRWYRTWAIDFIDTLDVYWRYDGDTIRMQDLPHRACDSARQWQQTYDLLTAYNLQTSASPAFDRAFAQLAAQRVKDSPLRYYVLLPVARDLNMWLRPRTEMMKLPVDWWNVPAHPKRSAAALAYALWNAAYLSLAVAGLWLWHRHRWSIQPALAAAMVAFVALRFALLLTLDNSEPRYTLECFPVIILLAGIALSQARRPKTDQIEAQSSKPTP
jgi:hypothetical protein